jgi:hypothetical protein
MLVETCSSLCHLPAQASYHKLEERCQQLQDDRQQLLDVQDDADRHISAAKGSLLPSADIR